MFTPAAPPVEWHQVFDGVLEVDGGHADELGVFQRCRGMAIEGEMHMRVAVLVVYSLLGHAALGDGEQIPKLLLPIALQRPGASELSVLETISRNDAMEGLGLLELDAEDGF